MSALPSNLVLFSEAASAVETLCQTAHQYVRAGRWSGGFSLIEADLMAEFKLSRSTVRESLRRLETEGLIQRGRGRNMIVTRLSRADVRDIFAIRAQVEPYGAELMAQNFAALSAQAKAEFEAVVEAATSLVPSRLGKSFADANREFHVLIMRLCGNRYVFSTRANTMVSLFTAQFQALLKHDNSAFALAEHEAIANAIRAGDAAAARAAMLAHVQSTEREIMALGDEMFRLD